VLSILSRREEGFCAEDSIIATAFAAQAAVALENSRLYDEIQRAYVYRFTGQASYGRLLSGTMAVAKPMVPPG
jgi:hypothetical protein